MTALYLVITTHTARHLRLVLLGVANQSRPADRIVISSDNDRPEIGELVHACAAEFKLPLTLVHRPFQGASRSAQVRNNGVRALLHGGVADDARLVFLDGDCCPGPGTLGAHERLAGRAELVIGFRVDLTPEQTEALDEGALGRGEAPAPISPGQDALLRARARRYRRHAFLRRIGLIKPHKPKVLSANFSVTLDVFRRINGFDEEYFGYGGEDDDLGRRLYRAGARPAIGITEAVVYHLWHPTRAAADWENSPGIARFKQKTPDRAVFGLDRPFDQPEPLITILASDQNHESTKERKHDLKPA